MNASRITLYLSIYWLVISVLARVFTGTWNYWFASTALIMSIVSYYLTTKNNEKRIF